MKKVFDDKVVSRAMQAAGRAAVSGDKDIRAGKFVPPASSSTRQSTLKAH
ncbi:MAG: hypothetical protein M3N05_03715 [Pseudomonadota bacterium]|nr:hypothetical protein [Pseudomonadota bacterium]